MYPPRPGALILAALLGSLFLASPAAGNPAADPGDAPTAVDRGDPANPGQAAAPGPEALKPRRLPALPGPGGVARLRAVGAAAGGGEEAGDEARPEAGAATGMMPALSTSGAAGAPVTLTAPAPLEAGGPGSMPGVGPSDWTPGFNADFEAGLGDEWLLFDGSDDGFERTWGVDDSRSAGGNRSAWVAAGGAQGMDPERGGYPPNLYSWMVTRQPVDLSRVAAADIEFMLNYGTEPEADWVFVGASVDGETFHGYRWWGESGGWQAVGIDLAPFVGAPQVYLAWVFRSDASIEGAGAWVDDVTLWAYEESPDPPATQLLQNGDFERGDLSGWTVPTGSTVITREAQNPVQGRHVAYFGGIPDASETFYQPVALPAGDVGRARLSYWLNQFGNETVPGADRFCGGIMSQDLASTLVDFGCLDGVWAPADDFEARNWRRVDIDLMGDAWRRLAGRTVNVRFEMYTDGARETSVYVDDVVLEIATTGPSGDAYERNNSFSEAKPIPVGAWVTDLTIDPDDDVDFFYIDAVAGSRIAVDIDAEVLGSSLDSVVGVFDGGGQLLCLNDDEGESLDSFLECTATADGRHYVVVVSYDGRGGRSARYRLQVSLGAVPPTATATPPAEPPTSQPPYPGPDTPTPVPTDPGTGRTWTAMLYIAGDNNLCRFYPPLIRRMESELASKIGPGGFLTIVVLFDRANGFCDSGETSRYVIQPGGNYTEGVNRWDMGEVNMGDPRTLVNFARWAKQNYPAEHYYLAIDDHGNGPAGIAWDDSNGHDNLTPNELYGAVKEITDNGREPLALLAYEACLLGMIETAYDMRHLTKHLFFFPTISWANSAAYPSYFGHPRFTRSANGRDLGEVVMQVYYEAVPQPYVESLVESRRMEAVGSALSAFGAALAGELPGRRAALERGRSRAQKVDTNVDDRLGDDDDYIDAWDLADKLAAEGVAVAEAAALKQAIEAAVVGLEIRSAGELAYGNSHGLTLFWPQVPWGVYDPYVGDGIFNSTRDGGWDEFLEAYFAGHGRRGMPLRPGPVERRGALPSVLPPAGVAASSALTRWPADRLLDGDPATVWSSIGHVEHLAGAEWAVVQLGGRREVDGVRLAPRRDRSNPGWALGFPKDFVLQYSDDGEGRTCNPVDPRFRADSNWRPLVTRYGYRQPPGDPIPFGFEAVDAACVRLLGTELSQDDYGFRYLQLAEIEVLFAGAPLPPAGAATSSALPGWPIERLVDGRTDTVWSSVGHADHLAAGEWLAITLPQRTRITGARLAPRPDPANPGLSLGFPKDFVLQYSVEGDGFSCNPASSRFAEATNWRPLATRYGFNQPTGDGVEFAFAPREVGCMRLLGTELSQDDYGNRYLQLAELQALSGPEVVAGARPAASSALPRWGVERVTDGDPRTSWSSRIHGEHLAGAEWAAVLLPAPRLLGGVRITPRQDPALPSLSHGFPKDFVVQYSLNGEGLTCNPADPQFPQAANWRPLATRYNFSQPGSGPIEFGFPPRPVSCVRLLGAELSQDGFGNRYLQLGEIELVGESP